MNSFAEFQNNCSPYVSNNIYKNNFIFAFTDLYIYIFNYHIKNNNLLSN